MLASSRASSHSGFFANTKFVFTANPIVGLPAKAIAQPTLLLELWPRPTPTLSYDEHFPNDRLIAMTAVTDTLLQALDSCDMLIIDELHAFDFYLDEQEQLHVECMNGRTLEYWRFTPAQMQAATFDKASNYWIITSDSGDHHLECVEATSGHDDEDDEHEDA